MKNKNIDIKRKFYSMVSNDNGASADVTMYGEIVESVPVNWWTGEPVEGSYIVRKEFLDDLESLRKCKAVTLHIDSVGGDAGVAFFIHNKLREMADNGTALTCIVDGVAMSGGSIIMCACDTVKVNASSLIMIHKAWSSLFGGYNADDLRELAKSCDAYDKAQASVYTKKTGLSETVVLHMMGETTYMTGREAVEKGFADELLDAEPVAIAASANGTSLFVKGREMHLASGMFAPDNIPTVSAVEQTEEIKENQTEVTVNEEGGNNMTASELREQYPEAVEEIVREARAESDANAVSAAVTAERSRIESIDAIACLYDGDTVREAKFGANACTAQELAYRVAQQSAKAGQTFAQNLEADAQESNTGAVASAEAPAEEPVEDGEKTPEQKMADARALVKKLFQSK